MEELELAGIGVDAWGVDYALLGERGELLENPYHYRDRRTEGMMEEVFRKVEREEIYQATGIQFMPINTLYQLFAARAIHPQAFLKRRNDLLTIPDLFNYWLTGNAVCEFTNATTTQMVDPRSGPGPRPDAAPGTARPFVGTHRRAGHRSLGRCCPKSPAIPLSPARR